MNSFSTTYRIRVFDADGNIVNWYDYNKNTTPQPLTVVLDDPKLNFLGDVEVVDPVSVTDIDPKEINGSLNNERKRQTT